MKNISIVLSFCCCCLTPLFGQPTTPPTLPGNWPTECCDLFIARCAYSIALRYYAKHDSIPIYNDPNWERNNLFLRKFVVKLPDGKVVPVLRDERHLYRAAESGLAIHDVPTALGMLGQVSEYITNYGKEEGCDTTCFGPSFDITKRLRKLKDDMMIYKEEKQQVWQKDDRTGFALIDSLLKLHFTPESLKKAKQYQKIKANKRAVVMVVEIDEIDDTTYKDHVLVKGGVLKNIPYDDEGNTICPSQRYSEQMSLNCLGTGFFIGKNLVATAAHLFGDGEKLCEKVKIGHIRFIAGVEEPLRKVDSGVLVPKSQVFKPSSAEIGRGKCKQTARGDWALIGVKPAYAKSCGTYRPKALTIGTLKDSAYLYAFGHGLGLTLKFAFDARTNPYSSSQADYFTGNLDMFGGNSGSPVFNAQTHELIGLLTGGEPDFKYEDSSKCLKYNEKDGSQFGEQILNIKALFSALENNKYIALPKINKVTHVKPSLETGNAEKRLVGATLSINRTERKRMYAPYLYLHRNAPNSYTVCIMVPIPNNQETIRLDSTKVHSQQVTYYYSIQPALTTVDTFARDMQPLNMAFDSGARVKVVVKAAARDYVAMLNVDYADTAKLAFKNNWALCAPYSYLAKEEKPGYYVYYPYLLIPVEDDSIQSEVAVKTDSVNFKTTIGLQSAANTGIRVLQPTTTDTSTYTTQLSLEGNFTTTVDVPTFAGNPSTKSKTVHPNRGADEKPKKKKPTRPKTKK